MMTLKKFFKHILDRDIPWPDVPQEMSFSARDLIDALLNLDPNERPSARTVKISPFFSTIDWPNLLKKDMPFVPRPSSLTDTSYFEARNTAQKLKFSSIILSPKVPKKDSE
eukprot:Sdes_comp18020_c0_seq1m7313